MQELRELGKVHITTISYIIQESAEAVQAKDKFIKITLTKYLYYTRTDFLKHIF